MTPIILLGGGGHCRSLIDVIERSGQFQITGIVDQPERVGDRVLGYPVIGCDTDLPAIAREVSLACVAIARIKSTVLRAHSSVLERLAAREFRSVRRIDLHREPRRAGHTRRSSRYCF